MNSRPFNRSAQKTFRPAFDYLASWSSRPGVHAPSSQPSRRKQKQKQESDRYGAHHRRQNSSLDDTDCDYDYDRDYNDNNDNNNNNNNNNHLSHNLNLNLDANMQGARRSHSTHNSLSDLQPPVPLIDLDSRNSSPYPRSRSAAQSEDDDDDNDNDDDEPASSIRPLVGHSSPKALFTQGGLGAFFFGTWTGWQVWIGLLVFWVGGCSFGLLLMNRFIMLTGVYKFPFPLTQTYVQLLVTHGILLVFSMLTRALALPLRRMGFGAAVAPAMPVAPQGGAFRGSSTNRLTLLQVGRWLFTTSGGIAGGGLFEFDYHIAKQLLPLAIIFVAKVLLSNYSYAYAPLPVYQLARIGVTPLAIIFSCVLQRDSYSGSTLSSALVATLNLFFASLRSHVRVTWESIVAGVFSSFFVALYPIILLRSYRTLVAGLVPQGDVLTGYPSSAEEAGNREETRAYYRLLHYVSLLSIMMLTPIVLFSGELGAIYHNIPFLDVPFFWFMIWCGSLGSFSVFFSLPLLAKMTSPLTATFVQIPRSAFQLMVLSLFKMPAHSWIGLVLCWVSSIWYVFARRNEMRSKDRVRLEGW